jgi:tetratricopeptide (TPR) repeat protein
MKKILPLIILIVCLLGKTSHAQEDPVLDSLFSVLKTQKEDTSKVNTLIRLTDQLGIAGDFERSLSYGAKAIQLAKKTGFKKGEMEAYYYVGYSYDDQRNYPEAIKNYTSSLKIAGETNNMKGICDANNNIGYVYAIQGNYPEAHKYFDLALAAGKASGNKKSLRSAYNNLGINFERQGNFPEAIKYDLEDLKISEEMGDKQGMAQTYMNIGNIYSYQHNFKDALKNYNSSLKYASEAGDKRGEAYATVSIGNVYRSLNNFSGALTNYNKGLSFFEKGEMAGEIGITNTDIAITYSLMKNPEEALKYYFRALKMYEIIGDSSAIAGSFINIAGEYKTLGKLSESEEFFRKGLKIAETFNIKAFSKNGYKGLSELDSLRNNWKGAYFNHKLYVQFRDSLFNEENTRKTVQAQMTYEFDKKQAIEQARTSQEIEKQKMQRNGFIGGFTLVLILGGVSYRGYRNKKKASEIISAQKKEVENQKHLIEEKQQEIIDSITYAKRLQEAILPPSNLWNKNLPDSFVLYKPKDIVAGDFYYMEHVNDIVLFAAADCTGHGVPGAMVSVVCSNALNRAVKEFGITDPGKILDKVRELVIETFEKSESEVKDGMDISFCVINKSNSKLMWAGANNPLWVIRNKTAEIEEIKADKQPIGKYSEPKPFTTHTITLNKGDTFYIFTDGFADQFGGPKGKKFMSANMKKLFLSVQPEAMSAQRTIIDEAFSTWKGSLEQIDDVCVIGVRI